MNSYRMQLRLPTIERTKKCPDITDILNFHSSDLTLTKEMSIFISFSVSLSNRYVLNSQLLLTQNLLLKLFRVLAGLIQDP